MQFVKRRKRRRKKTPVIHVVVKRSDQWYSVIVTFVIATLTVTYPEVTSDGSSLGDCWSSSVDRESKPSQKLSIDHKASTATDPGCLQPVSSFASGNGEPVDASRAGCKSSAGDHPHCCRHLHQRFFAAGNRKSQLPVPPSSLAEIGRHFLLETRLLLGKTIYDSHLRSDLRLLSSQRMLSS